MLQAHVYHGENDGTPSIHMLIDWLTGFHHPEFGGTGNNNVYLVSITITTSYSHMTNTRIAISRMDPPQEDKFISVITTNSSGR